MHNLNKHIIVIAFCMFILSTPLSAQAAPQAVATFHSIGLKWPLSQGSTSKNCEVLYRKVGDESWSQAFSLWFDERQAASGQR